MEYIQALENAIGKKANMQMLPLQKGDVLDTLANVDDLSHDVGFVPNTKLQDGIDKFISWYRQYYKP